MNDSLFRALRRTASDWFVRRYMARIAGRYCPCEWPIKSKRLMHLCGRIDDAHERLLFRDFSALYMQPSNPTTTSGTITTTVTYARKKHGGKP